ncbi:hypothetical protein PSTT_11068, partial [Puccinia striiformis]
VQINESDYHPIPTSGSVHCHHVLIAKPISSICRPRHLIRQRIPTSSNANLVQKPFYQIPLLGQQPVQQDQQQKKRAEELGLTNDLWRLNIMRSLAYPPKLRHSKSRLLIEEWHSKCIQTKSGRSRSRGKIQIIAYNTLSDPELRKKYNEFGKQQENDGGFVDPEAVFSTLFGGEKFQDIIGTISLGQEMKTAMQKESDDDDEPDNEAGSQLVSTTNQPPATSPTSKAATKPTLTPEQKAKRDAPNQKSGSGFEMPEYQIGDKLKSKLYLYTEQADEEFDQQVMDSVRMIWEIEKDTLAEESFGPELLRTVGATYVAKSKRCLTATATGAWGGGVAVVGGWFHSAKSTAHVLSETVGAVRAAYDVKAVFDELAKAEAEGGPGLTEERKKELEEQAAKKGLRALFMGAKLEVESVIREVCDRLLEEPGVTRDVIRILGSVFETAKSKNGEDTLAGLENGYVKVDPSKKGASAHSPTNKDPKAAPKTTTSTTR